MVIWYKKSIWKSLQGTDNQDGFSSLCETSCLYYKIILIIYVDRHLRCLYYKGVLVLTCVINYDGKCDATIWSVNLATLKASFTLVICL